MPEDSPHRESSERVGFWTRSKAALNEHGVSCDPHHRCVDARWDHPADPPRLTTAEATVKPHANYAEAAEKLERWIRTEIDQKEIPGLSIALIDDQQVVWAQGFGYADARRRIPASAETVYRVGSVSKLFTDIALMQLVEQGLLDLDAPVRDYLPEFTPKQTTGKPITLRHLMSHRSGLVRESPVGNYFDPTGPTLTETVKSLNETTLVYDPEFKSKYSECGHCRGGARAGAGGGRGVCPGHVTPVARTTQARSHPVHANV